jgi:hypothetical protein
MLGIVASKLLVVVMITVEPLTVEQLSEVSADTEQNNAITGEPVRHTAQGHEIVDITVISNATVDRIMMTLLKRSGLSKGALARKMGVSRASLQPYYRGTRKNHVSIKFLTKMITAAGGKLIVKLPEGPNAA